MDSQYASHRYKINEVEHRYGENVHILSDPYLTTRLARLCHASCVQPEFNELVASLYWSLGREVANQAFPREQSEMPTRMSEHNPEGVFAGEVISPKTKVVVVSLARAGIVPAFELFKMYTGLLPQENSRVDHIFINRAVDEQKRVTGAPINATKIGGPVDGAYVIFPDPMGATGSSMINAIDLYKKTVPGKAKKWVSINMMITPEYVRALTKAHPDVEIFSLRLDRGLSSEKALKAPPGEFPDEERGLNDQHYIVPGAGGLGEISNNSFV